MKKILITFALFTSAISALAAVQVVPAFPKLKFTGNPLFLTHAPDNSNRIFVVEQNGKVWGFNNNADVDPSQLKVFADFSSVISREGPELGLLGMAFAPNFVQSRTVFFSFTDASWSLVVVKATVLAGDEDRIDPRSVEEIIRIKKMQRENNHNGGMLAFSPKDGLLYIGTGDGGGGGDPLGNSQDKSRLLGKILRIDPFRPMSARVRYSVPMDNPFVSDPRAQPEIFALGLRNPWRFSFDRQSGLLFVGDVGQSRFEEINIVRRGGNYGWSVYEALQSYRNPGALPPTFFQSPIFAYGREQGVSITGGYVYRGKDLPELNGWYIYGDFGTGRIWGLTYDGSKVTQNREFARIPAIASFGEDQQGELYVVTLLGSIYKITH